MNTITVGSCECCLATNVVLDLLSIESLSFQVCERCRKEVLENAMQRHEEDLKVLMDAIDKTL